MKSISTIFEGLLDADLDIKDENIRAQIIISNLNKFWNGPQQQYGESIIGHMLSCKESELLSNIYTINSPVYDSSRLESKLDDGHFVMILRSRGQYVAVQFIWKNKKEINVYPGVILTGPGVKFRSLLEYKNWITGNVKAGTRIWLTQKCLSLTKSEGEQIIQYFINKK